jgi:hypothetical protein
MESYEALRSLKDADKAAITEIAQALREGKVDRDEIPYILSYVVEAITAQSGDIEKGAKNKFMLFSLHQILSDALTKIELVPEELGDIRKNLGRISSRLNEARDFHIQSAQRYEDLVALAMIGPEAGLAQLGEVEKKAVASVSRNAFRQVISTGAALMKVAQGETSDGRFAEVAEGCLVNALRFANAEVTVYAAEALSAVGHDARDQLSDRIWEGTMRKDAIEAYITLFKQDKVALYTLVVMAEKSYDVRKELSGIARDTDNAISRLAGQVMAQIRIRDELDSVVQDREFLCDLLPDSTSPQRAYIECVFDSVERILGGAPTDLEYQIALKQLSTFGADPGAMKELLDDHTLKLIKKNVENALLHALATSGFKAIAAAGLEKIGSDRIEHILERIEARGGEGAHTASETLERIRGRKVEETMEFIPQKPPKLPAREQKPRLAQ